MLDTSDTDLPQQQLGRLLRSIRQKHRYSINEVADQTGISSSFLSLVETGKSDISFGRLMRLTEFYGVTLTELFPGDDHADITITRREDSVTVPAFAEGIQMMLLAAGAKSTMTTFVASYEAGASMSEPTLHDGEAFAYIVEGSISVQLEGDGDPVVLNQGDSAHLNTRARRTYRNVGAGRATLLGVLLALPDGTYPPRPPTPYEDV